MSSLRLTISTFASEEDAVRVARALLDECMTACATILPPARSIYRWQGIVEDSSEVIVLFKTPAPAFPQFSKRLSQLHPYETPEVVSWDASEISPSYLAWAFDSCHLALPARVGENPVRE